MWSLASRPAPAGKCKRAGEQSGAAPGSARSELLAASGRPAARQARCEPAASREPALGEGAAAVPAPPARPRRGVRPHCEPAAGRAEVGRAGSAAAAAALLTQYPSSGRSDLGPGGSRGASVTQKAVELYPGARGPAHAAAERSAPYRLSFPSNFDREAGPTRAAEGPGEPAGGQEMPLLHRKPFERQKPPADLRPDEEVFYCKVTNEIFRHYE